MTDYFDIIQPEKRSPIVISVPHAGVWIPDDVRPPMLIGDEDTKRDLDLYVDEIWKGCSVLGATVVSANVSRYVVDLNRAADDVCDITVVDGVRRNCAGYYQERGVVWKTATDGTELIAAAMSQDEFSTRIKTFHTPYHGVLNEALTQAKEQHGYAILIDAHSMPSLGGKNKKGRASRRADIVPGDLRGQSCHPSITKQVNNHFRERGFSVSINSPYEGGWITRSIGRPSENIHAIQIEINRDLYMHEKTYQKNTDGIERLADTCYSLVAKITTLQIPT